MRSSLQEAGAGVNGGSPDQMVAGRRSPPPHPQGNNRWPSLVRGWPLARIDRERGSPHRTWRGSKSVPATALAHRETRRVARHCERLDHMAHSRRVADHVS